MKTIQAQYIAKGVCRADATIQVTPESSVAIQGIAQQVLQLHEVFRNFSMHTALIDRIVLAKLSLLMTTGVPFEVMVDKMVIDLYRGREPHITLFNNKSETAIATKISASELRDLAAIETHGNLCADCDQESPDLVCTSCQHRTLQALEEKLFSGDQQRNTEMVDA